MINANTTYKLLMRLFISFIVVTAITAPILGIGLFFQIVHISEAINLYYAESDLNYLYNIEIFSSTKIVLGIVIGFLSSIISLSISYTLTKLNQTKRKLQNYESN